MRARFALYVAAVCLCCATILPAQDAVKVDPKHYTVVSENDQVRILKVHYGPHEKSVMHSHPNTVAVFLTFRWNYQASSEKEMGQRRPGYFRRAAG